MLVLPDPSIDHVPPRVSLGERLGDVAVQGLLASHREHAARGALPPHEHGQAYLCVVLDGGYVQATYREVECSRGSLVSHPAGHVHANRFGLQPTRCVNIYFEPEWMADAALADMFHDFHHVALDPHDAALARLGREMESLDAGSRLGVASAVLDIAGRAVRGVGVDTVPAWLGRVRDAIASDPAQPPELATLAAEAGVHRAHLCRAFRAATGETIGAYSRRLRLEAADAMIPSDLSIAEIAAATGFYDQAHFARCFRRQYGVAPSARRAQRTS